MKVISYMVNMAGGCYDVTAMTSLDDPQNTNQPTSVEIVPSTEIEILDKVKGQIEGELFRSPGTIRVVPTTEVRLQRY